MKALVIYESFFGNTEKIAQAIGEALSFQDEVGVIKVGDVRPGMLTGVELLIVGSPTRAFKATPGVSGFLKELPPNSLSGVKVAAFDTRMPMEVIESPIARSLLSVLSKLFGYAAKPIANRLEKKGGQLLVPPEGFFVLGSEGPLKEGEIERAAEWARRIEAAL